MDVMTSKGPGGAQGGGFPLLLLVLSLAAGPLLPFGCGNGDGQTQQPTACGEDPKALSARQIAEKLKQDPDQVSERMLCDLALTIVGSSAAHGTKDVAGDHTTLWGVAPNDVTYSAMDVDDLFNAPGTAVFPCGSGPNGLTLCENVAPVPQDRSYTFYGVYADAIPQADPVNHYQYGFVFDQDGNPANNYVAPPAYPNDFFHGTDRWYVATYTPGGGWVLEVSDATGGVPVPLASNARVIIVDNVMSLTVPEGEFAVPYPPVRWTAFRHTGDWGVPSGNWDGSVWPPVANGLQTWP
jgi:hypothetical protein